MTNQNPAESTLSNLSTDLAIAAHRPFNLTRWIEEHRELLRPPVANRQIWRDSDMIVMIVGGGNERCDFHDDPRPEFFHQLKGDMTLMLWDGNGTKPYPLSIREGEVYLLPSGIRHSPQRPDPESIGLVVEYQRNPGELDGFEWACLECHALIHRVEVQVQAIDVDLPPLFNAFDASELARTCPRCKALHPGKRGRL